MDMYLRLSAPDIARCVRGRGGGIWLDVHDGHLASPPTALLPGQVASGWPSDATLPELASAAPACAGCQAQV